MIAAVIVAAGQGLRMDSAERKQFLTLGDKPILLHAVEPFLFCAAIEYVIVVLPVQEMNTERLKIFNHLPQEKLQFVSGGQSRRESVRNGLLAIEEQEGIVLIHDGVRPLVTVALIEACIHGAQRWDACIPALEMVDTVKRVDENGLITETLPRRQLWLAQTPQAFNLSLIRSAHQLAEKEQWSTTDDASLLERMGICVKVIPGLHANLKITTSQDMHLAEAYLRLSETK